MASVYRKKNLIYISFYDPTTGKSRDRSTGLAYTKSNLKLAKDMAKQLQRKLDEEKENHRSLKIEKITIQLAFDHFKQINGDKNEKTLKEYDWFFKRFTEYFDPKSQCTAIDKRSTEIWLSSLRQFNYSKNSLHSYTKVLKKFLGFLFEYSYTPVFKVNKDVLHKPEVKPIITFDDEDIKLIFNNLSEKNVNFTTTIYLLFYTGLRPSDIYEIKVEDIDLKRGVFKYYSPKTKEHFIVPIHNELLPELKRRCKEIGSGRIIAYEKINNIGKAFRRYLKHLGIDGKGYTLRTFRKTFISLAHDSGIDLATVSKLVGHRQISTTAKFYHKLDISKQITELNKLKTNKKEKQKMKINESEFTNLTSLKGMIPESLVVLLTHFIDEEYVDGVIDEIVSSLRKTEKAEVPARMFYVIAKACERLSWGDDELFPDTFILTKDKTEIEILM